MKATVASEPTNTPIRFSFIAPFAGLSVAWFSSIICCRIGELMYTGNMHGVPGSLPTVVGASVLADLIYFLQSSFVLFVIYFFLSFLSATLARLVYMGLCLLLILVQVALTVYFGKTSVLLGADLFSYSMNEISLTVGATGELSVGLIGGLVGILVLGVLLFRFIPNKVKPGASWVLFTVGLGALMSMFNGALQASTPHLEAEYANNLVINKSAHIVQATLTRLTGTTDYGVDIYTDAYIGDYGATVTDSTIKQINFLAERQFPFLHYDETPDVLGPFFNRASTPPNVVIIVVEGLGRAFSGSDAYLGSFTPFIDSLAQQSLYWENFLSQGGRTFAVLPAILGSLPFAQQGFSDLGSRMPAHLSLPGILKKNGYAPAFYYGGNAQFDNMRLLLRKQGVDRVIDEPTYGVGYQKMPSANGFTWGYGDKDLFRHYLAVNNPTDARPRLQILLTVSTHDPFRINEQKVYLQKAEERFQFLRLTESKKQERRNYSLQFASILYADDALRQFFASYQKRPDFNRTIFMITGDHRMPEIPMATKLDRYHVPLIVYSPLLKRRATFRSISTHADICPTVLAFLKTNYALKTPSVVSWLGTGIDTTRQFQNVHSSPLKMTKAELVDFVMGPYMLNQDKLYRISSNMNLEPVEDPGQFNRLKATFDQFKRKNDQFLGTKMVPDSLLTRYN